MAGGAKGGDYLESHWTQLEHDSFVEGVKTHGTNPARGLTSAEAKAKALVLSTYSRTGIGTSLNGSFEVECTVVGMRMRVTCTDVHVAALVYNTFKGKGEHGVKAKAAALALDYDGLKQIAATLVASAWARAETGATTAQQKAAVQAAMARSEAAMAMAWAR
jgi:hypothetical protein